jgi:hypothetical protein
MKEVSWIFSAFFSLLSEKCTTFAANVASEESYNNDYDAFQPDTC